MKRTITAAMALLLPATAWAQKTYFIDEGTDYSNHGCEFGAQGNLNAVTASLYIALSTASWTGSRYTNSSAWPQDFVESCNASYAVGGTTNGLDNSYADTKTLAVFAGHGNSGKIGFNYPHNGSNCLLSLQSNIRIGSMNGASSGYGMWLSSNTLAVADLANTANWQWTRQQFGFNNSPGIADDEPRDFFNATQTTVNSDAWLNEMQGLSREPVVVSYDTNESNCWSIHDSAKLKANIWVSPRGSGPACQAGQPGFWYCYEWVDVP